MSYTDDASPAPPFGSGSETGDIFAGSDLISGSPTTSERVVDTQSGYLIVLKKSKGGRLALSVKRRLGTTPGSSIVFTPDEQVKLARILAEAKNSSWQGTPSRQVDSHSADTQSSSHNKRENRHEHRSSRAEKWLNSLSRKTRAGGEELLSSAAPGKEFARVSAERELDRTIASRGRRNALNRAQTLLVVVALFVVPTLAIVGIGKMFTKNKHEIQGVPATDSTASSIGATAMNASANQQLDKFVRGFVADMLDFNPTSYKFSQIRAMSVMTPPLMDKYWTETHFPLTKPQLQRTPKGQTLMITKVEQVSAADHTFKVNLFAELVSANSKISTPVHLFLKVDQLPDGQFQVLEQSDLSGK